MKRMILTLALSSLLALAQQQTESKILHRVTPNYPALAKLQRIEGVVTVALEIDERGLVSEARIISGPQELRRAALRAVLDWQYEPTGKPARANVDLNFTLLRESEKTPRGILKSIEFAQVPPAVEARVRPRLLLKEGDVLPHGAEDVVRQAVAEADLKLLVYLTEDNRLVVETRPQSIRVGGNEQAMKLEHKVRPLYPPEAKQARIQGTVRMDALIDRRGNIFSLDVVKGHPQLTGAALTAVRQWRYQPTLLNGEPVEVMTRIDVNFTLNP